jgi:single-strand DNA-binding protein
MGTANLTITARLARPPELRETNGGTSICELTLPVDTGYGDNKTTTWWRAKLFGKRAETAAKYLDKGQWVMVSGSPQVREYTKRDGDTAYSCELVANDFAFVGNKSDNGGDAKPARSKSTRSKPARSYDTDLSDVPF